MPTYGPVDAAFGFALFYLLVDRAGPTIEAVVTDVFPSVSPATVGVALAALGVGSEDDISKQERALARLDAGG